MNNKIEKLYIEIFEYLGTFIQINNRDNKSNITIILDFEISEINATKKTFPGVRLVGCWFHLKKNLVKNGIIKKNIVKGLKK